MTTAHIAIALSGVALVLSIYANIVATIAVNKLATLQRERRQ